MVDQKLSMSALSTLEATLPIDPRRPAWRSRCPKSQEVYCAPRSRVDHRAGFGASAPACHLERVDDDLCGDPIRDRPPDDPARVGVDDRGAVDPSVPRAVLGDVAEPETVRRVRAELPLHEVLVRGRVWLPSPPFAAMRDPDQPVRPHQPRDALPCDVNAETEPQLGEHPRRSIGLSRGGVNASDCGGQLCVGDRAW